MTILADQKLVAALALILFAGFVVFACIRRHHKRSKQSYSHESTEIGRRILEEDRKLNETPEQRVRRCF